MQVKDRLSFKHVLSLGLAAAVALGSTLPLHAAEVPSISHAELVKAVKARKVVLLDVNGTDSYKAGHIPGALNFETVGSNLKTKLPANKKALIVAYCANPMCGAYKRGAAAAKKLGYTNVKHYSPGIMGWKKSGAPVAKIAKS
jgi:rhodanese-related sulfurtransferase